MTETLCSSKMMAYNFKAVVKQDFSIAKGQ